MPQLLTVVKRDQKRLPFAGRWLVGESRDLTEIADQTAYQIAPAGVLEGTDDTAAQPSRQVAAAQRRQKEKCALSQIRTGCCDSTLNDAIGESGIDLAQYLDRFAQGRPIVGEANQCLGGRG